MNDPSVELSEKQEALTRQTTWDFSDLGASSSTAR